MNTQDWKPVVLRKSNSNCNSNSKPKNKQYKISKKLQIQISQARTNLKMTQEELANKMKVTKDIIRAWESNSKLLVGQNKPTPKFLHNLSIHLKVKLHKLDEIILDD